MKILFIANKHNGIMRQGLMYLSSVLKKDNFEVHYLDTADYEKAEDFVKKESPDLLIYSLTSGEYNHYNEINQKLKKYKIMSVVGGPHVF